MTPSPKWIKLPCGGIGPKEWEYIKNLCLWWGGEVVGCDP